MCNALPVVISRDLWNCVAQHVGLSWLILANCTAVESDQLQRYMYHNLNCCLPHLQVHDLTPRALEQAHTKGTFEHAIAEHNEVDNVLRNLLVLEPIHWLGQQLSQRVAKFGHEDVVEEMMKGGKQTLKQCNGRYHSNWENHTVTGEHHTVTCVILYSS